MATPFSEPHRIARLVIVEGDQRGTIYPLYRKQVLIGRIDSAHLQLDDGRVSRLHARVCRQDKGFVLEDLGSRSGTRINGQPVEGAQRLHDGDQIQIGAAVIRYET